MEQIAIKLVDNGSTDDYGTIQFDLVGSSTLNISSDSPIYDGEFHSVMLTRLESMLVMVEHMVRMFQVVS